MARGYSVMPAQACSYKVGQTVIQRLRDQAQTRASFDMKRFHDAVLRDGRVPLTVLERRVRQALA
jgi:uncharacterized protein (DUF885 family)